MVGYWLACLSDPPLPARVELAVRQIDAGYDTEIAVVDVPVVVVLDLHDLVARQKVQPKRSMRDSRGGFSSL